jgi:propionyl-CoA synthetase
VIDHWWQTETGWPMVAAPTGLDQVPTKPGSPTFPVPGYDVRVVDESGQVVPPMTEGTIVVRLPLPPGSLPTLWNDDDRYVESYLSAFPGYYLSGDGGYIDEDGYVYVMGRIDDVINVAGHRLSTGVMEQVLLTHPAVAECAVIGVQDQLKGQLPRGLVVLKAGSTISPDELQAELVAMVREHVGAVAAFKQVSVVSALPKTRSGKILRKSMRAIADGRHEAVPSTIDDPAVLERLRPILTGQTDHEAPAG